MKTKKEKKLELELFELVDFANVTSDNKLNLQGIFDEIYVEKLPVMHPKMYAVTIVNGEPNEEYVADVIIRDPKGKQVGQVELKSKPGRNGKLNLIVEIINLEIDSIGNYIFEFSNKGRILSERKLEIKRKQQ